MWRQVSEISRSHSSRFQRAQIGIHLLILLSNSCKVLQGKDTNLKHSPNITIFILPCIPGLGRVNSSLFKSCANQKVTLQLNRLGQHYSKLLLIVAVQHRTTRPIVLDAQPDNYAEIRTHLHIFVMMTITAFCRTMMSWYDHIYSGFLTWYFLMTKWYFQNLVALEIFRKTNKVFESPCKEYFLLQKAFIFF